MRGTSDLFWNFRAIRNVGVWQKVYNTAQDAGGGFLSISVVCTASHCDGVGEPALFLLPQDGNGYIDENELDALLRDLCEKNKQVISYYALTSQVDFTDPSRHNHTPLLALLTFTEEQK